MIRGEPVLGGMRAEPRHYHCPSCKSWVFTRATSPDWLVNLRATMLDDHGWVAPFVEFFRGQGFAWAATGARHSYETAPDDSEIGPLLAEYAAEGARPG